MKCRELLQAVFDECDCGLHGGIPPEEGLDNIRRLLGADEPASRVEPCGLCGALSPSSAKFCCSCGASFNGAPRSVDVAALRELLERAYAESLEEDIDDYTAACVLTGGIVAALALLAPERREPPGLPDGWSWSGPHVASDVCGFRVSTSSGHLGIHQAKSGFSVPIEVVEAVIAAHHIARRAR